MVTTLISGRITLNALVAVHLPQLLGLLYLGVVGSAVAYIGWYDGIRRIGATRGGPVCLSP